MFPNPQDALPFPTHPSLEHYKKRAKELVKAGRSSDPAAIRVWAADWVDSLVRLSKLPITPQLPVRVDQWTDQMEQFARHELSGTCSLSTAQLIIARAQGFESWPKLSNHLTAIVRANSPVNHFELAADAIVTGDAATLERLLSENPDLIRAHSTRRHQATLLHYISANGVEGYRQKTPENIVQIAELLLQSGADVNATADVYGGSTTLSLVATSLHPERAGVQNALMQLLLDHAAIVDLPTHPAGGIINICLANGRVHAAKFLCQHGAALDLEAAAGVGRLDVVKNYFDENGSLSPPATKSQMERGFLWSCECGENAVAEFLLQRGVSIETEGGTGHTALHWAIIGAHLDTINLLLVRNAPLEARNAYGGTALGQALWSAIHSAGEMNYVPVIETLLNAGARIEEGTRAWLDQQKPDQQKPNQQKPGSASLKRRIAEVLQRYGV